MTTIELAVDKKVILSHVHIAPIGCRLSELRDQLTDIYYQLWCAEGLCASRQEAAAKIDRFDPNQSFVVLDQENHAYALINTVTSDAPDIFELCRQFPTYQSVEQASFDHHSVTTPTFRVCFSITAIPGFRVQPRSTSKDISLSQFLLMHLPTEPDVYKIAYSRWPAVDLHKHFDAVSIGSLASRPEDLASHGKNILMLYGKTPAQTEIFKKLAAKRLTCPPQTITVGNAQIFTDVLDFL